MKNFVFKSSKPDLQKMFSTIEMLQKNILYITYNLDKCLAILRTQQADSGTQKQVDDYYGGGSVADPPPEEEDD